MDKIVLARLLKIASDCQDKKAKEYIINVICETYRSEVNEIGEILRIFNVSSKAEQ